MIKKGSKLSFPILLLLAVATIGTASAAIMYYYIVSIPTIQSQAPKIQILAGDDVTPTIGTNSTWVKLSISRLQPNATTVYTSFLKFKLLETPTTGVKLQIPLFTDTDNIIWGVRLYVFKTGASNYALTLVEGSRVTVGSTDGNAPVGQLGYRQTGASSGYGGTTLPQESSDLTESPQANDTYVIVTEIYGKDGILTSQSAVMQLRIILY